MRGRQSPVSPFHKPCKNTAPASPAASAHPPRRCVAALIAGVAQDHTAGGRSRMLVDVQRCAGLGCDLCHRLVEPAPPPAPLDERRGAVLLQRPSEPVGTAGIEPATPWPPVPFRASLGVAQWAPDQA